MKITSIILTYLAILAFLAGATFSYLNRGELKKLKALTEKYDQELVDLVAENQGSQSVEEGLEGELATLQTSKEEVLADMSETRSALETQTAQNDSLKRQIADLNTAITEKQERVGIYDGFAELVKDLQDKQDEIDGINAEIQKSNQVLASKQQVSDDLNKQSSQAFQALSDLRTGSMQPGFSTRVSSTSLQDGFVIISSGYQENVAAGAEFSLSRGGQQIATGKVSSVSANQAVVRLDPSSAKARVNTGDSAVFVPR